MKKNNQQRLILNIIIIVIAAFILIFMLLGKFLSPSEPVSSLPIKYEIKKNDEIAANELELKRDSNNA